MGDNNWDKLVEKYDKDIDGLYEGEDGQIYRFIGLIHASDDYCYGMFNIKTREFSMPSCVGSLAGHEWHINGESGFDKGWGYRKLAENKPKAPLPKKQLDGCEDLDLDSIEFQAQKHPLSPGTVIPRADYSFPPIDIDRELDSED